MLPELVCEPCPWQAAVRPADRSRSLAGSPSHLSQPAGGGVRRGARLSRLPRRGTRTSVSRKPPTPGVSRGPPCTLGSAGAPEFGTRGRGRLQAPRRAPLKGVDVHPAPVRDQERQRDGETGLPGQRGSPSLRPRRRPQPRLRGPLSCEPRPLLTPYMPPSASPAGPKFRASQARSAEEGAEVRAGRTAGHAKVSRRLKPLAPCIRGRDEGQRQAKRQAGPPAPASSAASCTLDAFGTLACVTLTPGNVHSGSFPVTPQSLPAALPRLADHRGHPQDT